MSKIYLEEQRNKVSSWSASPSNTNYTSEALVKGEVDAINRTNAIQQRQIDNLNEALGETTVIDYPDTTYQKGTVPSDVCKYAQVNNIIGVSSKFNQLVQNGNFASTSGWITNNCSFRVLNNEGIITITNNISSLYGNKNLIVGHKYYNKVDVFLDGTYTVYLHGGNAFVHHPQTTTANAWTNLNFIGTCNAIENGRPSVYTPDAPVGAVIKIRKYMTVDLTAMYGSGNEPATVAQFLADHPEYNGYVEYGYHMKSATITKVISRFKNIVNKDEEGIGLEGTLYTVYGGRNTEQKTQRTYLEGGTYTLSYTSSNPAYVYVKNVDTSTMIVDGILANVRTFTINSGNYFIWLWSSNIESISISNVQLELGSTATTYSAYGTDELTLPTPFTGRSAGTVHDVYTPITGVIDRNIGSVDLGSLTWTYESATPRFYTDIVGGNPGTTNLLTPKYIFGNIYSPSEDKCMSYSVNRTLSIKDTSYSDATAFKTAMNGVMLYYEKATATQESVTPINPFIQCEAGGEISLNHTESPATASKFQVEYANKQ